MWKISLSILGFFILTSCGGIAPSQELSDLQAVHDEDYVMYAQENHSGEYSFLTCLKATEDSENSACVPSMLTATGKAVAYSPEKDIFQESAKSVLHLETQTLLASSTTSIAAGGLALGSIKSLMNKGEWLQAKLLFESFKDRGSLSTGEKVAITQRLHTQNNLKIIQNMAKERWQELFNDVNTSLNTLSSKQQFQAIKNIDTFERKLVEAGIHKELYSKQGIDIVVKEVEIFQESNKAIEASILGKTNKIPILKRAYSFEYETWQDILRNIYESQSTGQTFLQRDHSTMMRLERGKTLKPSQATPKAIVTYKREPLLDQDLSPQPKTTPKASTHTAQKQNLLSKAKKGAGKLKHLGPIASLVIGVGTIAVIVQKAKSKTFTDLSSASNPSDPSDVNINGTADEKMLVTFVKHLQQPDTLVEVTSVQELAKALALQMMGRLNTQNQEQASQMLICLPSEARELEGSIIPVCQRVSS